MQQTVVDDRYILGKLLGSGGMAQVYLAHDEVLARDIALKILRNQYAEDKEFVERFRREARSAAGLSHPNIVSIYDQGCSEDGAYYMAMEYVPEGTLKDRIRRDGALAPDAAAGVALQIADALQAAHERGVIHRDIKPQNVLVTRAGDIKVTDFGIARAASSSATTTGTVLGTAGYMSPEQARGEPVGPASDLYSLGVVLYEMLTGNLPYEAESAVAQAIKHISEPPPSPREANPEVPKTLDALTVKLLAKNPEERYPSAAALANDLERVRARSLPAAEEPEKTKATTALLSPSPEERTRRTAAQPSVTGPGKAPEHGGGVRILPALAALLFAVVLLGGLVWALSNGYFSVPESVGTGDRSGTPNAVSQRVQVPELGYASMAAADLARVDLTLGRWSEVPSNADPAGVVIESVPQAGTEVAPGTAVDIIVSSGPAQVPVQKSQSGVASEASGASVQSSSQAASGAQQPAQPPFIADDEGEKGEGEED